MPLGPSLLSAALYLLPVFTLLWLRASRSRPTTEIAVVIPAAVAIDLLGIMVLTRLVRLDAAVLLSRAVWVLIVVVVIAGRRIGGQGHPAPGLRLPNQLAAVLAASAGLAFLLSAWRSHPYAPWDRQWHIPLVASLRGQAIPFVNIYQPQVHLGYHISGNVLAATLQTLSWGRLHSSVALSLAHDLMFVLTALSISALLFRADRGRRWSLFCALAPLAVLLAGPIAIGAAGGLGILNGFSYFNYYELSFRPHVVLGGLLITGIVSAVLTTVSPPGGKLEPRVLMAATPVLALLTVTDEPSAIMLVPALALVVFLGRRDLPTSPHWSVVVGLLPVVVGVSILVFPSTLVGMPRPATEVTAPHLPSLFAPAIPLPSVRGILTMLADVGPMMGILVLLAFIAMSPDPQARTLRPILAFGAFVFASAGLILTTVVIANSPGESHRFMTLPMLVLPLLGLYATPIGKPVLRGALVLVLVTPIVYTLVWAIARESAFRPFGPDRYAVGIHRMDCRAATAARLFEPVRPFYAPASAWYAWAGCHPIMAPARSLGGGQIVDVGRPVFGRAALQSLSARFVEPGSDLKVACPITATDDPICRYAIERGGCQPSGTDWVVCALTPGDRTRLTANLR
jgi:hypothetical protein